MELLSILFAVRRLQKVSRGDDAGVLGDGQLPLRSMMGATWRPVRHVLPGAADRRVESWPQGIEARFGTLPV
jgi:hypothetical protein